MKMYLLIVANVVLAGCVTVPGDRGSKDSIALLQSRSGVATDVRFDAKQESSELLQQPLDADAAVRVALNRNAHMQALYAQLGMAQADVYDASRLSNPSLGFLHVTGGGESRTTWSLTQSFTELLFLGYRTRVGRSQLLQAQQRVAQSVLDLEAQIRSAYYEYVAAQSIAHLREQDDLAAQAQADYAQRLFDAGNISELQLSREQAGASRARVDLQAALTHAEQQQAALLTAMGLSMHDKPAFVERLEVPMQLTLDPATLEQWTTQQRVDLGALREQVKLYSAVQTHTRRWFWLSDAGLQLERERDVDGSLLQGAGGSVGVPIFNQGTGSRLRAQAQWETARAGLQSLQLAINNDIAVQVASLQRARQIVEEYRQKLMPLQERVLALSQQQQNYMLIGAFELLNARREVTQTYQDYLLAVGDYWLRYVALCKTIGGKLPEAVGDPHVGVSLGVEPLPGDASMPQSETSPPDVPSKSDTDSHEHEMHMHTPMNKNGHSGDTP